MIKTFSELSTNEQAVAGGKGGTLARLYQDGYPVPDGFVILPDAFEGDELNQGTWEAVQIQLSAMRESNHRSAFAVRSSALSEDSAFASFAGEFETVLDVHTDEMVKEAIHTVRRSRDSERVRAYTQAKGVETDQADGGHEIAVVVQRLVRAATGNPLTATSVFWSKVKNRLIGRYDVNFWCGEFGFRDSDILEMLRRRFRLADKYDRAAVPDRNIDELVDIMALVRRLGFSSITFQPMVDDNLDIHRRDPDNPLRPSINRLEALDRAVDTIIAAGREDGFVGNSRQNLESIKDYFRNRLDTGRIQCYIGFIPYIVSPDGQLWSCMGNMGDVFEHGLRACWTWKLWRPERSPTGSILPSFMAN